MVRRDTVRKNKKNIIFGSVLVVVIFVSALSINAVESNEQTYSETIFFLGNKNIAPIIFEEDGEAEGIAVDLVKALEEKINFNIDVQALDWVEAQNKVLTGQADALIQINPSLDREELYDFSDEFLESEFSIFTNTMYPSIYTVEDLIGRTVGIEKGGYICQLLQEQDGIALTEIPSASDGLYRINTGDLDAIVVDRWLGEYELAQSNLSNIRIVDQPVERKYSRIAVKKGNDELLDTINTGLRKMKTDGSMSDIISNWQGKKVLYVTEERAIRLALNFLIGTIVLILLIATYLVNKYRTLSQQLEIDVVDRNKELQFANELLDRKSTRLNSSH